jgi:hypothetical protein
MIRHSRARGNPGERALRAPIDLIWFGFRNSNCGFGPIEGRPMASQKVEALRETASKVLESGDIYFAYRPKIDKQAARSIDDVQRLYMILHPRGKRSYRLIIVGEKRLPFVDGGGDDRGICARGRRAPCAMLYAASVTACDEARERCID